jgi:hypothetical protein
MAVGLLDHQIRPLQERRRDRQAGISAGYVAAIGSRILGSTSGYPSSCCRLLLPAPIAAIMRSLPRG